MTDHPLLNMSFGLYSELMPEEVREANDVGRQRQANAERIGAVGYQWTPDSLLVNHQRSARGEKAVNKHFPYLPWNKMEIGKADLGDRLDVKARTCTGSWYGGLIVPEGMVKPAWAYVLVVEVIEPSSWWSVGWAWGATLAAVPPRDLRAGAKRAHVLSATRGQWEVRHMHELQEIEGARAGIPGSRPMRTAAPIGEECAHCGRLIVGRLERVTYVGAPERGVAVHHTCVGMFFKKLDQDPPPRGVYSAHKKRPPPA